MGQKDTKVKQMKINPFFRAQKGSFYFFTSNKCLQQCIKAEKIEMKQFQNYRQILGHKNLQTPGEVRQESIMHQKKTTTLKR